MTQIIKPRKLSLISKTYSYRSHLFSVGALGFFKLGEDGTGKWEQGKNDQDKSDQDKYKQDRYSQLLNENEQWPRITSYLNQGVILDMGFAKANGELLVAGKAFADGGNPVQQMTVSASLGTIKKRLKVVGDRFWRGSGFSQVSEPEPFTSMPLSYQRAYGGTGYNLNPLGKGVIKKANRDPDNSQYALANIYYPDDNIKGDKKSRKVASFEPLDISWPQRSVFQGRYDKHWLKSVHPGFPHDTKNQLFNAAPQDQQIKGFFQPGDPYEITGMHPSQAKISGHLPKVRVRAFIQHLIDDEQQFKEVKTVIDTVWLFPDLELGIAIHRGVIAVNDSDGLDVKQLLLAYEGAADRPRSPDYYREVLHLRTDPETAPAHMLNESQLMPEKTESEREDIRQLYQQAKRLQLEKQKIYTEHLKNNEDLPEEAMQSMHDAEEDDLPLPPIPQALIDKGDIDLSPYLAQAKAMTEKGKVEAEQKIAESEQRKQQLGKMGKSNQVESLGSLKLRVFNPVYVTVEGAIEGAVEETVAGKSDNSNALDGQKSSGDLSLIQHIPPNEQAKLAENGTLGKLQQADQEMQRAKRQSRQMAPESMVLSLPLPKNSAQQIRNWVLEMLQQGLSLAGRDLAGADLSGIDFSGLDMRDVMLEKADLSRCQFNGCLLDGAVFTEANLDNAIFVGATMQMANLSAVTCSGVDLQGVNLTNAKLSKARFAHCDFSDAILDKVLALEVNLNDCTLSRVSCQDGQFTQAQLQRSHWQQAQLNGCFFLQANLEYSNWQQAQLYRCIMIDLKAKGVNFQKVRAELVQFSNLGDFRQANLSAAQWLTCGFRNLDLSECNAEKTAFVECDLSETEMRQAKLDGALFNRCIMLLVNLNGSDCRKTYFNETSLKKAQFNKADMRHVQMQNSDTSEAEFAHCRTRGFEQQPVASIR